MYFEKLWIYFKRCRNKHNPTQFCQTVRFITNLDYQYIWKSGSTKGVNIILIAYLHRMETELNTDYFSLFTFLKVKKNRNGRYILKLRRAGLDQNQMQLITVYLMIQLIKICLEENLTDYNNPCKYCKKDQYLFINKYYPLSDFIPHRAKYKLSGV